MEIGNLIKFWRETRNYTETYMASQLGISQSAYSKLEKGKIKIDAERLFRISVILEVSIDQLSPHKDNLANRVNPHKINYAAAKQIGSDVLDEQERMLYKELITEKEKQILEKQETISMLKEMLSYFKLKRIGRKLMSGKKAIR
jgi:transcriptional regulator with XRE-family HTH domain